MIRWLLTKAFYCVRKEKNWFRLYKFIILWNNIIAKSKKNMYLCCNLPHKSKKNFFACFFLLFGFLRGFSDKILFCRCLNFNLLPKKELCQQTVWKWDFVDFEDKRVHIGIYRRYINKLCLYYISFKLSFILKEFKT